MLPNFAMYNFYRMMFLNEIKSKIDIYIYRVRKVYEDTYIFVI